MSEDLEDVKREVAAANRVLANRVLANLGLATGVTAALGHASMRVPSQPDHFFVKGREYDYDALAIMEPDDMVMCDTEGFLIGGRAGLTQCSEVKIHACIYKTHPEIQAVVHVHPRYTILMSVLTGSLKPMRQEGAQMLRKPLPIYPHVKTIQSDAEGMEVAALLGDSPAILLRGHGAVTTGTALSEAVMGMAHLEEQAQMNYLACCAQGKNYNFLQDDVLDEMLNRDPALRAPALQRRAQGQGASKRRHLELSKKSGNVAQVRSFMKFRKPSSLTTACSTGRGTTSAADFVGPLLAPTEKSGRTPWLCSK